MADSVAGDWGPEMGNPAESDRPLLEQPLESRVLYSGRIVHLREERVRLSDGSEALREVVRHPGAVVLIPWDSQRERLILVRQYRHPAGRIFLELPAGKLDPGETPANCAARELSEETGFTAGRLEHVRSVYTCVGFSNEVLHFFLAEDLVPGEPSPDEGEWLQVVDLSLAQARTLLREGRIQDAKTMVGLHWFLDRLDHGTAP
ncbi:MAG: NUDIX hydrolase [Candidatus Cloacimonetes bacterium]|nr:NUDIX hydrolase [Candidatus Cloacimonadota bacterium]MCA9787150.1 NUDIX hydrolase [Candidatus Cloacimonadota bacterium]